MILVIILILLLVLLYSKHSKVHECFYLMKNVEFVDKETLIQMLINDNDNFYKYFFPNDYKVRNINNISEYKNRIISSVVNLNQEEKNKVIQCCNDIVDKKYSWFDNVKFNDIKWKIGSTSGKLYENGLSHTRNDVIIISKEYINKSSIKELTRTLLHEKVHIYQKLYPVDVDKFLDFYKFKKLKIRDGSDNTRANPDVDQWIYVDGNNMVYKAEYISNPKSLGDTKSRNQLYEHPFEKMAIEISSP